MVIALWLKVGGNVFFIKNETTIRRMLTPEVLMAIAAFNVPFAALLGYLQGNYTGHKKQVVEDFTNTE